MIMPFTNFENRHFSEIEKNEIDNLLIALEAILASKLAILSKEEYKYYKIKNNQIQFIEAINKYKIKEPKLISCEIDWILFNNNYEGCNYLQKTSNRLNNLVEGMTFAKTLFNYENFKLALEDFNYTNSMNITKEIDYKIKYDFLKKKIDDKWLVFLTRQ